MSNLQRIIDALQETDAALEHVRRNADGLQGSLASRLNRASVEKRRTDLVRQIDHLLTVEQRDLVRYRISRDWSESYPAKAVAASIYAFQELVTAVFDALQNGPKRRYRPSSESVDNSTFEFAGAGAGSVIISLAAMNDRLLFGDSNLDRTLNFVEQTLSARTSEDLHRLAKEVGVAAISKAYAWADASSTHGLDTTIKWGKRFNDAQEISISREDANTIKGIIENRSEEEVFPETMAGTLLGFDGTKPYFHFKGFGDDGLDISGTVQPSLSHVWTTARPYRAELLRKTQLTYSTGEEKTEWVLVSLTELPV